MLTCQRDLFSLPPEVHYLNAAYMGPLSLAAQEAGQQGIRRKARPYTIAAADFFEESEQARGLFAALVNASDARAVALVPSVSYGIASAAGSLQAQPGRSIVLAAEEFPSNVYPWRAVARQQGLVIRTVAPPAGVPGRGEAWNRAVLEAIDEDTACVALSHVHWTDGTLFDLETVGRRCREVGALFVVDGTQSVGALPFDVQRIQPDALVVAAYKWLLGPYAVALAYLGPRVLRDGRPLEETWLGRLGAEDFAGLVHYRDEYQPGAIRFDMGERSNLLLLPILIAALRQVQQWGAENVQAYGHTLLSPLVEDARGLGLTVEDDAWRAGHLVGLRLPATLDPARLQAELAARRVYVSRRGSALRVSAHVYNDEGDVAALRAALVAAAE